METMDLRGCRSCSLIVLVLGLVCCFLAASAGDISGKAAKPAGPQPVSAMVSLRVVPKQVTLWGARASQRFVVLGMYADGLERDVTSQSRFSISNPRLATIDQAGRVV